MNFKKFIFAANDDHAGMRIDKALATHPDIESRSHATNLLARGQVTLNNKKIKPSHKVRGGEIYAVVLDAPISAEITAYDYPLEILYEDSELLVVNKPSGLVVHPAAGHREKTLINALVYHLPELSSRFSGGRPGLVHRIDKDTSGLLVIAKTESALRFLALQFKKKTTHRVYLCVTNGSFKQKTGTFKTYLHRNPRDRKKFASEILRDKAVPKGKLAITHYKVLRENAAKKLSLVECKLETGRTHQIRVHLSETHHAIVGDPLYSSLKNKAPRLMLHAAELGFIHPKTKKEMRFLAPWPEDLHRFLTDLGFL